MMIHNRRRVSNYDRSADFEDVPHLSGRQREILLSLGEKGRMTKYALAKQEREVVNEKGKKVKERIRYPVVHNSMKSLGQKGLALVVAKKTGEKGAETLIYDLTQKGLFLLAATEKAFRLSEYAESHEEADSTFFRIWEYYETKNAQDVMKWIFRSLSEEALREERLRRALKIERRKSIESAAAGKAYLDYLASTAGTSVFEYVTHMLSASPMPSASDHYAHWLQSVRRYFVATVQDQHMCLCLRQGVQKSLREYRQKVKDKEWLLKMIEILDSLTEEGRKEGLGKEEIEHRLMENVEKMLSEYVSDLLNL